MLWRAGAGARAGEASGAGVESSWPEAVRLRARESDASLSGAAGQGRVDSEAEDQRRLLSVRGEPSSSAEEEEDVTGALYSSGRAQASSARSRGHLCVSQAACLTD